MVTYVKVLFLILNILICSLGSASEQEFKLVENMHYLDLEESLERAKEISVYSCYSSDNWEDLKPLFSSQNFLASASAHSTFQCTFEPSQTGLYTQHRYVRIIGENQQGAFDVARLITLPGDSPQTHFKGREGYSPEITRKIWKEVEPFLLPQTHKFTKVLDKICSTQRIFESAKAIEKAGFHIICHHEQRGLVVAKHSKLKKHLIKIYLDTSSQTDWSLWALRAKGARRIREIIDLHQYHFCMKVPKKWIYPVRDHLRPKAGHGIFPKDFILIVEDMDLVSETTSLQYFKTKMSYEKLDALYTTIGEGGLSDSHVGNIPFSRDQKIAFIDTEFVNNWPVHFDWLTKYFNVMHQRYWLRLIREGEAIP